MTVSKWLYNPPVEHVSLYITSYIELYDRLEKRNVQMPSRQLSPSAVISWAQINFADSLHSLAVGVVELRNPPLHLLVIGKLILYGRIRAQKHWWETRNKVKNRKCSVPEIYSFLLVPLKITSCLNIIPTFNINCLKII